MIRPLRRRGQGGQGRSNGIQQLRVGLGRQQGSQGLSFLKTVGGDWAGGRVGG
jgi:hypothetical protein